MRLARTALALQPARLPSVNYEQRQSLPQVAAVYIATEKGSVLYVGQTVDLRRRWRYHHLNYHPCVIKAVRIFYLEEPHWFNREQLEALLIIALRPKFNGHGISAKSNGIISSNLREWLRLAHCKSYSWDEKPKGKTK